MADYREFWNNLIFGTEHDFISPPNLEDYWFALITFAVILFILGLVFSGGRFPTIMTLVVFLLYVSALVPFMIWSASCTGCAATWDDEARSQELYILHVSWGGFFGMGVAALWLGVIAMKGVQLLRGQLVALSRLLSEVDKAAA